MRKTARFAIFIGMACMMAGSMRAGWIVDQKSGHDEPSRTEIGTSALKETYGKTDRIVDFAGSVVFRIDHTAKTVGRIDLDAFLQKSAADLRPDPEKPTLPDRVAGVDCMKFASTYSNADPQQAGGWGGAEGCVTKAISVAAPYTPKFEAWLRATQRFGDHGFLIWLRTQVDGPWHVNLYTTRVRQATLPPTEFRPPAEYKQVAFTWD